MTVPATILDRRGYPTEEALAAIETWDGALCDLFTQIIAPAMNEYGTLTVTRTIDSIYTVELATGGWSGCEEIVDALARTVVWSLGWEMTRRGGYYLLTFTREQWEPGSWDGTWGAVAGTRALAANAATDKATA